MCLKNSVSEPFKNTCNVKLLTCCVCQAIVAAVTYLLLMTAESFLNKNVKKLCDACVSVCLDSKVLAPLQY